MTRKEKAELIMFRTVQLQEAAKSYGQNQCGANACYLAREAEAFVDLIESVSRSKKRKV